ncbi:MAG: hypothetical protein K9H64_23625 [Bacteroidales bacterium]|nr:hypothetical protein [Bacteroidales bacterium]MCF8459031.1 hypothetical protein [Bacteroidales bacterium]
MRLNLLIRVCFAFVLLSLLSCSLNKEKEIKDNFDRGFQAVQLGNSPESLACFHTYLDLVADIPVNDSTATVYAMLSQLYHQADSVEAAIFFSDKATQYYSNRDTVKFAGLQLRKADFLLEALYLKECAYTLDTLPPILEKCNDKNLWLDYYLLRDKLKYETYGYWDKEEILPAFMLAEGMDGTPLLYGLKIRQATHDIFDWEFKKVDSLLTVLDSLSSNWQDKELQTDLKLCQAAYWDEQQDYMKTEGILSKLLQQYDTTYDQTRKLQIKTELARAKLNRKKYAESKKGIDDLLAYYKQKGNKFKELEIQYIRLDYLSSVGNYNHFNREIDYYIEMAEELGYQNMVYQLKILKGVSLKKDLKREKAIAVYDELIYDPEIQKYEKHYYYAYIQKASSSISNMQNDQAFEVMNDQNRIFRSQINNRIQYYYHLILGRLYYFEKDYQNSCNQFEKAKDFCSTIGYQHGYYTMLSNLSQVYAKLNKSDDFLIIANEAIKYFKEINNTKFLTRVNYDIGKFHFDRNDLIEANKYWLRSVEYKEKERLQADEQARKEILEKEIGLYYSIQKNYFKLNDFYGCYSIGERARSKWMEEKLNIDNTEMVVPSIKDIQLQMSYDQAFLVFSNQLYSKTLATLITKDSIYCQLADNFQYINDLLGIEHFMDHLKGNIDSLDYNKIQHSCPVVFENLDFHELKY